MPSAVEIPVLSDAVRRLGVPLSLATRSKGFLFVSGLPPLDPGTGALERGTIEAQTETCLRALRHVVECAGASLEAIAMVRIYAANAGHYDRINAVYARVFGAHLPSRTFVPVASWPMPFDIEIECVAEL